MELKTTIEIIIAVFFFLYIMRLNSRTKNKKIIPFRKPILRKNFSSKKNTKSKHEKFILSVRDYSYCKNDHSNEYIQSCWDELEHEYKSR